MMPLYSWSVPGRKQDSMTMGILKQSQVHANQAAFEDCLISGSRQCPGWLATMPTGRPSMLPTTMFWCVGLLSQEFVVEGRVVTSCMS